MKKLEFKRTPVVIIPYTLIVVALFVLVGMTKITWAECLGGLALLNVPAIFGLAQSDKSESSKDDDDDNTDTPILPPTTLGVMLIAWLAAFVISSTVGCGYGKTACAVIDVAQANCSWIRYLAEDGTVKEVRLTNAEANELGRLAAKRQAQKQRSEDAGAP